MIFEATAYWYTGQKTKTGTWPKEGRTVSVDPLVIPLGSHLIINGISGFVAEDVGSSIKGRKLDIYMVSRSRCLQWGRQNVEVRIVE